MLSVTVTGKSARIDGMAAKPTVPIYAGVRANP
jgi:hypothetical protein